MQHRGYSIDNLAFGMGGALLQKLNRDTQKFAFKCSSVTVASKDYDVWKDPVTDSGKKSKRGRLKLMKSDTGEFSTVSQDVLGPDVLQTVFRNGSLEVDQKWDEIVNRAARGNQKATLHVSA